MIEACARQFTSIPDKRQPGKVEYSLSDCLLGGLAMMYIQDSALLAFQRRLEETAGSNNLKTLFGVEAIPKDSQMRRLIDSIHPSEISPILPEFIRRLERTKVLQEYRVLGKYYLVPMDGSDYFGSSKISCPGCLFCKTQDGETFYHHKILQTIIAKPGKKEVLPLLAEEIRLEDGAKKQDCETNAAKRAIERLRTNHPRLPFLINGDDLFSKGPMVKEAKKAKMSFIFVAKPSDHKYLYDWLGGLKDTDEITSFEIHDKKGCIHRYRFCLNVPLREQGDVWVNWFAYDLVNEKGEVTYKNTWVTDLVPTKENIEEMVRCGRTRWKIENETFNTLKNQGYHIEHNFGHGKLHLSFNFFLLNLLAFFIHQILTLVDPLFQAALLRAGPKYRLWEYLRTLFNLFVWPSWEILIKKLFGDPGGIPPPW